MKCKLQKEVTQECTDSSVLGKNPHGELSLFNIKDQVYGNLGKVRGSWAVDTKVTETIIFMKLVQFKGSGISAKGIHIIMVKLDGFLVCMQNFDSKYVMNLAWRGALSCLGFHKLN